MAGGSDETEVVSVLNEYGHRIYVDPADQRGAKLVAAGGSLNPHSLDLWRAALALGPWDLVVDVGANYGEMLAIDELSTAPAIVAVEPNSKVLGYLEHTLSELDWAVDLEVRAVSSSSATNVPLMVPDAYSGTATLRPEQVEATTEAWTTVPVETTTLDELLLGRGCRNACIKIDIEGEELRALHGAAEAFRTLERVAVMVEILHMPVQTVAKLAREFPLFLLERETGRLVRAEGRDLDELGGQLYSGEVNWQDALLLTGTDGKQFAAEVQQQNSRRVAKRVVYTALFGDYEELQDQPVAAESDIPFICFTDNPSLTSDTWEVRLVEAALPKDSVRSARKLKVQGHPTLAEYDERIWVDNRVTLKADPSVILDDLLAEHDMALFEHSFRATVADEFDAVAAGGYDDSSRVYEQLLHYAEVDPDVLDAKPLWTGFMARRMTAPVRAAMEQWMDHILRYSRRDQLSVNLALAQHSVPTRHLEGSNRESEFHAWPPVSPALGRRAEKNHEAFAHAVRAPLLRLRALERDTADLIEAHKLAATKRDALIEKLSRQARQTERERNLALKERDKARAQVVALRSRVTRLRSRLAAVRATGDGAGPAGRGSTAPSGADTRAREGAARRGLRSLAARPTPRRLARRLPGPVKRRLHGYARRAEGQGSPRGGRRNTVG